MCTFEDFCVFPPIVSRSYHKRALFIDPVASSLKLSTIGRALHFYAAKMWVLLTHHCCGYQRIRANVWMINRYKVIFSYLSLWFPAPRDHVSTGVNTDAIAAEN